MNLFFISYLVEGSHNFRTEINVERLMVCDLLLLSYILQVEMIQAVAASKERWPGDLLPKASKSIMRTMSQSVSQSVSRPRVDV